MPPKVVTFDPFGPFDVRLTGRRLIDIDSLKTFWASTPLNSLFAQRGLYVFAVKGPGRGMRPLYVGRATRQTFGNECFNPSNQNKLNHGLPSRGHLCLFIVKYIPQGAGKRNSKAIENLESELIALAKASNPEQLLNIHGARPRYSLRINGVLNPGPGKPSAPANAFKNMIGI